MLRWLLSGSAYRYGPRAAEVPFFALFDASIFCKPMRRLGQTMLKVAPLGKRALKAGFTRTPEKVTPLPCKRFLHSLPAPSLTDFAVPNARSK